MKYSRSTTATLIPGFGGALYVFNNSRDRLVFFTSWGDFVAEGADHVAPTSCWALKHGRLTPQPNGGIGAALQSCSARADNTRMPVAARGRLHGLLVLVAAGEDATARLDEIKPVATAMGDAGMSLALSSIELRERLGIDALRDGLTGQPVQSPLPRRNARASLRGAEPTQNLMLARRSCLISITSSW